MRSEALTWMRIVVLLACSAEWERAQTGRIMLGAAEAASLSLDSWEWQAFTV